MQGGRELKARNCHVLQCKLGRNALGVPQHLLKAALSIFVGGLEVYLVSSYFWSGGGSNPDRIWDSARKI